MDTECSYLSLLSTEANFGIHFETAMALCLQQLDSGHLNIVILVKYETDADKVVSILKEVSSKMTYELEWVGRYKLRLIGKQPYIVIEPVFEKYKGADLLMVPALHNEILEDR